MNSFLGCEKTCDRRSLCEHGCLGYVERRVTVRIGDVVAHGSNLAETANRAEEDHRANQLTAGRIHLARRA